MYYVYLLLCKNGSIYTGSTDDVRRRFEAHRIGKGARFTRSFPPVKLLRTEKFKTRSLALKREAEIKGWKREQKITNLSIKLK